MFSSDLDEESDFADEGASEGIGDCLGEAVGAADGAADGLGLGGAGNGDPFRRSGPDRTGSALVGVRGSSLPVFTSPFSSCSKLVTERGVGTSGMSGIRLFERLRPSLEDSDSSSEPTLMLPALVRFLEFGHLPESGTSNPSWRWTLGGRYTDSALEGRGKSPGEAPSL